MENNLDKLFEDLYKNYQRMDNKSKEEFIQLIQNIDELAKSDSDIKSLNKAIERKFKRKIFIGQKEFDLEHLRNYIIHKIYHQKANDILRFSDLIWYILPYLKSFSDIKELNNFLSYVIQVNINFNDMVIPDKKNLVHIYQDIFKTKNKKVQIEILLEISKIIVAQASREELKNLNMVLEQNEQYKTIDITFCTHQTSSEIMNKYLPKTKSQSWYLQNCIGDVRPPHCTVTGRPGGAPFYTKDRKIMRSGPTTWSVLDIHPCEPKNEEINLNQSSTKNENSF